MAAIEAVDFMMKDHGDIGEGFREDFAKDKPYKSILQRQGKELDDVLKLFDWNEDGALWTAEYAKPANSQDKMNLIKYRRRVAFCVGGWREFNEDFKRGDVSCLRDIRTPLVTSRTPLKSAKDEFIGK